MKGAFTGKTLRDAAQAACDLGLRLGELRGEADDTVYAQAPAPGASVLAGNFVNLKAR